MMQVSQLLQFSPLRLAIVMLGDRLSVAAIQRDRREVFTIDAENPGAALRAELDARNLVARKVAIGLVRSAVTVKPIERPSHAGAPHADADRKTTRLNSSNLSISYAVF